MTFLFYVVAVVYVVVMLHAYEEILDRRFSKAITYTTAIVGNIVLFYLVMSLPYSSFRAVGTLLLYIINVLVYYDTSILIAMNVGGTYLVVNYCVRGIVFSLSSIMMNVSVRDIVDQRDFYYALNVLSSVIALVLLYIYRNIMIKPQRIRTFYTQKTQLRFFVITMYTCMLFLVLLNDGRSLEIREKWFSIVYLVASVLTQLILAFVYNHLLELTEYIEREMIEASLIQSLESKLDFYKVLETQSLSIRKFKHDYTKVMGILNYYIDNNDLDGLKSYLEETDLIVNNPMAYEVQFSNHTLLDAMLQNASNQAREMGITFDARVSVPDGFEMKDLDLVRLFGNLIENALTASQTVDNGFITLIGVPKKQWFTIEVTNNFDGVVKTQKGHLVTTKEDKALHGHGLRIIQEVTDQYYGVFTTQVDEHNQTFSAKVSLSYTPK